MTPAVEPNALEAMTEFLYLAPVGLMTFALDGRIRLANPLVAQLLIPLAPGGDLSDAYTALAPLVPDLARRVRGFAATSGIIIDHERCPIAMGARQAVLSVTVHRIHGGMNLGMLEDVSRQVEQDRQLFEDRQRFQAIFDNVRDYAIFTVDPQGKIDEWNQTLLRFGGWRAEDVLGRTLDIFLPAEVRGTAAPDTLLANARQAGSVEIEGWRIRRDGSRLWTNTVVTALPDVSGAVRGFVVVSRDMTQRKRIEDELRRLATTDPLTGAFNRRHGQTLLADTFGDDGDRRRQPGLLMLDIDHFKAINDRHGHETGDTALRAAVEACRAVLGDAGSVVRWGGEEFLIILPDATEAAATAERLRAAVGDLRIAAGEDSIGITVSIGVAADHGDGPHGVVRRADAALYSAKRGGRNRVVIAPDVTAVV